MRKALFLFLLTFSSLCSSAQLTGTYTIGGTSPDFQTISDAQDALQNSGISGPVIFNIRPGTYYDAIMVSSITGVSIINTITFQSELLNTSSVVIINAGSLSMSLAFTKYIIIRYLSFSGYCSVGHCDHIYVNNCAFYDNSMGSRFSLDYTPFSMIMANIFKVNVFIGYGQKDTLINNYFFENLSIGYANYTVVINNNFSLARGKYLDIHANYCQVKNNNMPELCSDSQGNSNVTNNNYPVGNPLNDLHPYFINPGYRSVSDLTATNIQLLGKGKYHSFLAYDRSGTVRNNPPSIGANEMCLNDTANVFCGDSILLYSCSFPMNGRFQWNPSTGLNNDTIASPLLKAQSSQWYYVNESSGNFNDSIFINVIPFQIAAGPDDTIFYCGYGTTLSSTFNAGAIYQWNPSDSLQNSTNYSSFANPSQTTSYIITADVLGCGISSDSMNLVVNPDPTGLIYLASTIFNTVCFQNATRCGDTFFWDFGDGTGSTDFSPCHIFTSTGIFTVSMIACNAFGCDTISASVSVDSVINSTNEISLAYDSPELFPLPVVSLLTVRAASVINNISIYNLSGESVVMVSVGKSETTIDLQNLPKGIYIISIQIADRLVVKKVIIN